MMSNIKYLAMDVDGTLTDGKIYMGSTGEIMKAFNIKDGCGIHDILIPTGIIPLVITGRTSKILENRCNEIGIKHLYQGITDKLSKLTEITRELETVAYIGDDINDLAVIKAVKSAGGLIGCPSDATDSVKEHSVFIASKKGGEGAVREFIEYIVGL